METGVKAGLSVRETHMLLTGSVCFTLNVVEGVEGFYQGWAINCILLSKDWVIELGTSRKKN